MATTTHLADRSVLEIADNSGRSGKHLLVDVGVVGCCDFEETVKLSEQYACMYNSVFNPDTNGWV